MVDRPTESISFMTSLAQKRLCLEGIRARHTGSGRAAVSLELNCHVTITDLIRCDMVKGLTTANFR